ncbi:pyruvate oxidase [Oceanobacillus jeddahense]|uniref:Pyruvate oxidase n=1 Tax=Oceanobacillus jeddahense TaxID=1462527 RepID=A0ABY5JUD1_9BACI|nr:pyruvate oxidase [Oceanobacillus jeddahense]UUI03087.1 pyruvate oxidase [Oceanobacillus jeddahense]
MFDDRAGKVLVDLLEDWGVNHIYGMPGDSINNLMEELRKVEDKIKFIQVRHEEAGALAAASYAKLTGKIGVCLSIAGPGAIHLLNGLYDAKEDGAPVLVLAGQVPTDQIGTDSFQEVNMERLFDDVAVYNKEVASEEQLPSMVNQAIRTAYAENGVAVLTLPDDIPTEKIKNKVQKNAVMYETPALTPDTATMQEAAAAIEKAKKPIILAGTGVKQAKEELATFSDTIAAPVVISLPAKGVMEDEHPNFLGNLGMIGTKPAYEAMEDADLLILLGTSYPYTEFLPEGITCIQIDSDPLQIGKRYPVDIGVAGDAKKTLTWFIEQLPRTEKRDFLEKYQEKMNSWREEMKADEELTSTPIKPQQVIHAVQDIAADDAILSVDVGNVTVWSTRHFRMKTTQDFLISSWLGTMGCGLPGAIAGKIAFPDRQVISLCGDGAFSMNMQDFLTAVKYQLPMIIVIFNNERIGMIKYEQEAGGHLDYKTGLESFNFAQFAENCGGKGYRVEKFEDLKPSLEAAKSFNQPTIIDVCIEDEPPIPGKLSYDQITNYSKQTIKKLFEKGKLELPPIRKGLKRM